MILPVILFIIGAGASMFHWIGIAVAGFGLSLLGRSVKAKFGYGAVAGFAIWFIFLIQLLYTGILSKAFSTEILFLLSLLFSLILGGLSGVASSFMLDEREL